MKIGVKRDYAEAGLAETNFTDDEVALYDRQIRLWGVESQKRLREANVLLIGIGGLGAEIAKNIALTGVKSLTVLDDQLIQEKDFRVQFLIAGCEVGKYRAKESVPAIQQLNRNVEVKSDTESVEKKPDDFFSQFTLICATECPTHVLYKLNKICKENSMKFLCGDVFGFYGYCFLDLGKHVFTLTMPFHTGSNEMLQQYVEYCSLEKALSLVSGKHGSGLSRKTCNIFFLLHITLAFHEKFNRLPSPEARDTDFEELKSIRETVMEKLGFDAEKVDDEMLGSVFGEINPICAVVGGILASEMTKAISGNQRTINNFLLFDGHNSNGAMENIGNKSSQNVNA